MMLLRSKKYQLPQFHIIYKSLTNFLLLKLKKYSFIIDNTRYISCPSTFQLIIFNSILYVVPIYTEIFAFGSKATFFNLSVNTKLTFKYFDTLLKTIFFLAKQKFETNIILSGLGFKYEIKKNILYLNIGYSHYFKLFLPILFTIEVIETSTFNIKSNSHISLGNFIFTLTKLKKINPYTADGISFLKILYIS